MIPVLLIVLEVLALFILIVLGMLLTLLLAILLVPFWVRAIFAHDEEYKGRVGVRWLWGLLELDFTFLGQTRLVALDLLGVRIMTRAIKPASPAKKIEKAQKKTEKKAKKKEKKKKPRRPAGERLERAMTLGQEISFGAIKESVVAFLQAFFSSLRIRLSGELKVGLSDPSDTGMLLGLSSAVSGALGLTDFPVYPDWDEPGIKGKASLSGRLWLGHLMLIAIKTAFSRSIRIIWWPYVREKLNFFGKIRPQAVKR